jgi:hypothetical protein
VTVARRRGGARSSEHGDEQIRIGRSEVASEQAHVGWTALGPVPKLRGRRGRDSGIDDSGLDPDMVKRGGELRSAWDRAKKNELPGTIAPLE